MRKYGVLQALLRALSPDTYQRRYRQGNVQRMVIDQREGDVALSYLQKALLLLRELLRGGSSPSLRVFLPSARAIALARDCND